MAEDKQKLSTADQDYGTGSVGGEEEGDGETSGEGPASPHTRQSCSSVVDTRYLRSIEGILKLITIVGISHNYIILLLIHLSHTHMHTRADICNCWNNCNFCCPLFWTQWMVLFRRHWLHYLCAHHTHFGDICAQFLHEPNRCKSSELEIL